MDAFKVVEDKHKEIRTQNQSIKLKINDFSKRFDEYHKMAIMKKEQYENYSKTVQEKVDEIYYVWK